VDDLLLAFLSLKNKAAKIGLHVNVKKCEHITADQSVIHKFLSIAPGIATGRILSVAKLFQSTKTSVRHVSTVASSPIMMIVSIRSTLECILNVQLANNAYMQASLPVSAGGLGVRTAYQIVLPGILSSTIGCTDLYRKLLPSRFQSMTGSLD